MLYCPLLTVQQVSDALHVDFKVGDFDVYLKVGVHAIDMVKHVLDNPRYDTLHLRLTKNTLCVYGEGRERENEIRYLKAAVL